MLFVEFFLWKVHNTFFFCPVFFVYPLPPLASSKMKIDFWNKSCGHSLHFFADPGASYYNYLLLQLLFFERKKLSIKINMDFSPYYTLKKGVVPFGSEKCNMMPSPTPISRHMFWKINEYTDILILLYFFSSFQYLSCFWYLIGIRYVIIWIFFRSLDNFWNKNELYKEILF